MFNALLYLCLISQATSISRWNLSPIKEIFERARHVRQHPQEVVAEGMDQLQVQGHGLRPVVIFSSDCSSSTAIIDALRDMTQAICKARIAPLMNEHFKYFKNIDKFTNYTVHHPEDQIIIKVSPDFHSPADTRDAVTRVLRESQAVLGFTYRGQVLDRLVCTIIDCMNHKENWAQYFPEDVGYPVFSSNGTQANLCFQRRKFNVDTQAIVNVKQVVPVLEQIRQRNLAQSKDVRSLDANAPSVDTTELWAYERDSSNASLILSTSAWAQLLQIVPACSEIKSSSLELKIAQYLADPAHGRDQYREEPHSQSIRNADELHTTVKESGSAELMRLFRSE